MNPSHCVLAVLSLYAMASSSSAAGGGGCKYSVDSYTTTDAMIVTEAAFIAQVSAECEDSPSNLYAEVEGKLVVAANAGANKYQVRTNRTRAEMARFQSARLCRKSWASISPDGWEEAGALIPSDTVLSPQIT